VLGSERCGPICVSRVYLIGIDSAAQEAGAAGQLIEPKVIEHLHQRVVEVAQERGVTRAEYAGRSNGGGKATIHYADRQQLSGVTARGVADAHHEEIESSPEVLNASARRILS